MWKGKWRQRYLESADFLELAQREGEPADEFVYRISEGCRHYLEYVADILKRGADFCLPTDGPAARISRLGLLAPAVEVLVLRGRRQLLLRRPVDLGRRRGHQRRCR